MDTSRLLALDFETSLSKPHPILREIGVVLGDQTWRVRVQHDAVVQLTELEAFARPADFVLGHNIIAHDLPVLRRLRPQSPILQLPVIDTLLLSPLAHPEKPYHALIKDYKLTTGVKNDPVGDSKLALLVYREQLGELERRYSQGSRLLSVFRTWFLGDGLEGSPFEDNGGLARVFAQLGGECLTEVELVQVVTQELGLLCCRVALKRLLESIEGVEACAFAYVVSWLSVSGSQSVLPAFVRHRFPIVVDYIRQLRTERCGDDACAWCREQQDARLQLQRCFGFDDFRPSPADQSGQGLQRQIVEHGMAGGSHLAILPTGGGKSLCFQLPALVRNQQRGVLTIVISPLQALMKDQVDGLVRRTNTDAAAALNGLLTPPERAHVLTGIKMGDVAILYVSPEQLRNTSFRKAILTREIGAWVFDEAHCVSKWGHDFRPDYLYAGRFIRELAEEQGVAPPPVACMTATAKREVREEIVEYFKRELGHELRLFEGGIERENLSYRVEMVAAQEKNGRVYELVRDCLLQHREGSVVVYHATRKKADAMAEYLVGRDIDAVAYHAGLSVPERKRVQDQFIQDGVRVICATNAFGMGVDKDNVRLVVHAEIPGSLENYLQEAGRAGRDREPAEAMLLYDASDLETQFDLARQARLSQRDIQQILRGLRKFGQKKIDGFVISAGELVRDPSVDASFDVEDRDAATKVVTAISWLERAEFLLRNENMTRVFQGTPAVSLVEARAKIAKLDIVPLKQRAWMHLLEILARAKPDEGLSVDDLAGSDELRALAWAEQRRHAPPALEQPVNADDVSQVAEAEPAYGERPLDPRMVSRVILEAFQEMAKVGLIRTGMRLTAFVRYKVRDGSEQRLKSICAFEDSLLAKMGELGMMLEVGDWGQASLRSLNQAMLEEHPQSVPERVRKLLMSLSQDGRGMSGGVGSLLLRQKSQDRFDFKLQRDWGKVRGTSIRRREVAQVCLDALLQRVPKGTAATAELLVDFEFEDLTRAIEQDLQLRFQVTDKLAAVERALLFLHEHEVIVLQSGLAVFHPAMTLKFQPDQSGRRYTKREYEPLEDHYSERTVQIHVMDKYAQVSTSDDGVDQSDFVRAYFDDANEDFVDRFFPEAKADLRRATGKKSYAEIVTELGNKTQQKIVSAAAGANQLVLAGPGSGKTRVVVHRCAYLLRVARVRPESVLILCFNRSTVRELRVRLSALVGAAGKRVTIQTYDSLALRIVGRSLAAPPLAGAQPAFAQPAFAQPAGEILGIEAILKQAKLDAVALLRGDTSIDGLDPDDLRDAMLSGYEQILVDEYQDIDGVQYDMISAIAGRTSKDDDRKLGVLAVGDDDQNVYEWRGADVRYIRQFEADYKAQVHSLVDNYRSTPNIVAASSQVIARNPDRMKAASVFRSAPARALKGEGGEWGRIDQVSKGRVQLVVVPDALVQARALVDEIVRVRALWPSRAWHDFAVVARQWSELSSVRALLEERGIPCRLDRSRGLPSLFRVREVSVLMGCLHRRRSDKPMIDRCELAELVSVLREGASCPWWDYAQALVDGFLEERSADCFSILELLDALSESIHGDKDRSWFGEGVLLSTVHSVKGREYPFVFVLDGKWEPRQDSSIEAERRLYYVGMTRAVDGLWLGCRRDQRNPFVRDVSGDHVQVVDHGGDVGGDHAQCHYDTIGMDGLWLGFAGRKQGRVHQVLAGLKAGVALELRGEGDYMYLASGGVDVAALSGAARKLWRPRIDQIERIEVLCLCQRRHDDGESTSEFRQRLRVDEWSIPIVEVVWRG